LGTEVPTDDVVAILTRLGLQVRRAGKTIHAIPPVARRDLEREEDLIEEVARHYGYDRIPEAMPVELMQQGRRPARLEAEAAVRDVLVRSGLTEAITVSLISMPLLDRLNLDPQHPWRAAVHLENPLTSEHTRLRPCLLPSLLEAVRVNVSRRRETVHLFEIGRVFNRVRDGQIRERRSLAIAIRGAWIIGDWSAPAENTQATFYHLTGVLEALGAELRVGSTSIAVDGPQWPDPSAPSWLHSARTGWVVVDRQPIGTVGELHPDVAARFDLPGRTYVCEIDLETLLDRAVLQPRFSGLPRHPAVRRDVAVVAPVDLPHAAVRGALWVSVGNLLENVELFDVYAGPPLEEGTRNLAYTLTFRAADRTLTGEEVDALIRQVHTALPARLPVTIRT
jgi:phenylalanyl-tRNA synthetase beta chain